MLLSNPTEWSFMFPASLPITEVTGGKLSQIYCKVNHPYRPLKRAGSDWQTLTRHVPNSS